jgi:integrase
VFSFLDLFRRPLSLDTAVLLYIDHTTGVTERRRKKMAALIRYWGAAGCHTDARRITTADFVRFRAFYSESFRPVTIETYVSMMNTLLRLLGPRTASTPQGLGRLNDVPWSGKPLVVVMQPKPPAALEHLSLLYQFAGQFDYAPRGFENRQFLRAFLVIAYNTGLRFSDLTQRLNWSGVNVETKTITVTASKTGKVQLIPINGTLAGHLVSMPRVSELVLPIPMRSQFWFRKQLNELCYCIELPNVSPQAIRRATGNEFEKAHPGAGALILGHSLPRQTAITWTNYIAALETVLRPASERIPQPWPQTDLAPELTEEIQHVGHDQHATDDRAHS